MPPVDDYLSALTLPREILIAAGQQLADDVNRLPPSKSFQGQSKNAEPPANSPPLVVSLTAAELLLALGKITTPRSLNIVDLSSQWAYFRYAWAFNPSQNSRRLRLSQDAWEIDFHQKSVMSDDMGIGFTAFLMENYYDAPTSMDVDVALRSQMIPGLRRLSRTLPDYLFEDRQGNYYIVECKGTRQGRTQVLRQLRRGLEQVPSLQFPAGTQPVRLIIGTKTNRQSIEVFIVDPPPDESESMSKGKNNRRTYEIKDRETFDKNVQDIRRANQFLFAGATAMAYEAYPQTEEKQKLGKLPLVQYPPSTIFSDELEREFVGSQQSFRFASRSETVTIFMGVPTQGYRALVENDMDLVEEIGIEVYREAQRAKNHLPGIDYQGSQISEFINGRLRVDVFSKDGSILRIEVEE